MWDGDFGEIFESTKNLSERFVRKINEYLDSNELLVTFDGIWNLEGFEEDIVDKERAREVFNSLQGKMIQAREIIVLWQKQLIDAGMEKVYAGEDFELPSLWWEGSDGWSMAQEGDISGLEDYLDEILSYGPNLRKRSNYESQED